MTTKEQYAANPQKHREAARRYRQANLEKIRTENRERQRKKRAEHPELFQQKDSIRRHGAEYIKIWAELWEAQDGSCYLCGDELDPERAYLDHDHRCCPQRASCQYCRRGLTCMKCNLLIGHADDDPERLRRIADSLEEAMADVTLRLSRKPQQLRLLG